MMAPRWSKSPPDVARSRKSCLSVLFLFIVIGFLVPSPSQAELQIVTAEGEYRMGDRDTREDAIRLATEAAKRAALEQVATYVEAVTVANALDITKDEIRTYTAGVILATEQRVTTRLEGDTVIIHVDLTGQVDPEEVTKAVLALRQNEDARQELQELRTEVDQLHEQLNQANAQLATAASTEQAQAATQQRQDMLNRVQANGLIAQAWTGWFVTPVVPPAPWVRAIYMQNLVARAWALSPANPHLIVLQSVIHVPVPIPVAPPTAVPPPIVAAPIRAFPRIPSAVPRAALPGPPLAQLRPPFLPPPQFRHAPSLPPPMINHQPSHVPHGSVPHFRGGHARGRR